jgi:hypothetical protein
MILRENMRFLFWPLEGHLYFYEDTVYSDLCREFFIASGVGLSPLYCGHFWPTVPVPDDR